MSMDEANEYQAEAQRKVTNPQCQEYILANLTGVDDVYDNITEFPREEADGAEEVDTSYETMARSNCSIRFINDSVLKEGWRGSRKQAKQFEFSSNHAARARSYRTDEGHRNSLYTDADREGRKVELINSTSDGWVYVAAGWKKKRVTSERGEPCQTNGFRLSQKTKLTFAENETKVRDSRNEDNNRLVAGNSQLKTFDRHTLPTKSERKTTQDTDKSVLSSFRDIHKSRSNTDSIVTGTSMLYEFPANEIELKTRNPDKESQRQLSNSDKETEKEIGNDSDDDYEPVYIRSLTVKKCPGDSEAPLSASLAPQPRSPSPVPIPRKERVPTTCTKPQPKPRSKGTCLQPTKGEKSVVSAPQSSTPPKQTLSDINSNLIFPPPIPQRTQGQFCQKKHEPHNQRKRIPVKTPRSPKSTVAENMIAKELASSPPHKKHPLLTLQPTSPDAKAPVQSKPPLLAPTSRNHDTDKPSYVVILPEITEDYSSSESKDTQFSAPRRPPKSYTITKQMKSESRTTSAESVDRCKMSLTPSPIPIAAKKDKEGYLLPVDNPPLHRREKMQSVTKEISPVCSSPQSPPPRPPKTYPNKKSPIPSPTKSKPGTLLRDVSPALKPSLSPELSTLPRASPSISRSVKGTSDFNAMDETARKLKSRFSTSKCDPGYETRPSPDNWYACRDITRESFISVCPLWSYEDIEERVIPHKTNKKTTKDQSPIKQFQPTVKIQRQVHQPDGIIFSGQANGAQNIMTAPYEDMGLQSFSIQQRNVERHDVIKESTNSSGRTADQYEEVDQYEDVEAPGSAAKSKETRQYEVMPNTITTSSGPSEDYEDMNSHNDTTQNQMIGQYEDTRPSEKSSCRITANNDAADEYEEVTSPIVTATQSYDGYEVLSSEAVNAQALKQYEDLRPTAVSAAHSHSADQGVAAACNWSTTSGNECKTVNKTKIESKKETLTQDGKEALRSVLTQIEQKSKTRGDDFEDIDIIQLYLVAKERLRE